MADSVSTEAWLDQRRWAALEEALKAQGSNVKRHLQDYLITLYNETVPLERWVQIETAITKEELESAQAAEDQKVYAAFHIRENGHDSIFSTGNGEEFLDVAIRLRRYLQGDAEAVKGGFSHHFYKTQPITRERFDELAALRLENTGKVSGAFEIDLDAGWGSALNLADGWQTFKNKDVSTAAYHANRTRNLQRNEQWRRLVDYLYGRNIELQTFGSIETRGIRPLREGDLTFSEEIILSGHGLNFQFDFTSDEAQREVLGPAADCLEPGGLAGYSLQLRRRTAGGRRHPFPYSTSPGWSGTETFHLSPGKRRTGSFAKTDGSGLPRQDRENAERLLRTVGYGA